MICKVFGLVELLEHILLQVPSIYDLAICQRVSRSWKSVIDSSEGLQRQLGYRISGCSAWELNPLVSHFLCLATDYTKKSGWQPFDVDFPGNNPKLPSTDGEEQRLGSPDTYGSWRRM